MATMSKNAPRWQELQKIIGQQGVDEATLTDPELASRLSAFQEASAFEPEFDPQKFARTMQERLVGNGMEPFAAEKVAHQLAASASHSVNGGMPFNPQSTYLPEINSSSLQDVLNLSRQELGDGGYKTGPTDYSGDVKRLQDLTQQRTNRAQSQGQADEFVSGLPEELARGREQLFQGEAQNANQYYNDYLAPEVAQGLNSRGLLYSGDLESELSRTAGDVQGSLENAYTNQQSQDDAFFQNAAYQQTFMNEIQAGSDLSGQIANQRNQASQSQGMNFQRNQADLSRQFQALLQQKQQNRALEAQSAQNRRQQDAQDSQKGAALGGAVGQIGGALIGNYFLPGAGGAIGGETGKNFGQVAGGLNT